MRNTLNVTLSLDTETIAAFDAESIDRRMSMNAILNEILERRYADPAYQAEVETVLVRAVAERDRARNSAILHEASAQRLIDLICAALVDGRVIASTGFLADLRQLTGVAL